jgi:hypothetical protein
VKSMQYNSEPWNSLNICLNIAESHENLCRDRQPFDALILYRTQLYITVNTLRLLHYGQLV